MKKYIILNISDEKIQIFEKIPEAISCIKECIFSKKEFIIIKSENGKNEILSLEGKEDSNIYAVLSGDIF